MKNIKNINKNYIFSVIIK